MPVGIDWLMIWVIRLIMCVIVAFIYFVDDAELDVVKFNNYVNDILWCYTLAKHVVM